jgi:hypothetical protein
MPEKSVNAVNSADKLEDVFKSIDGFIDETLVGLSAVQTGKFDKQEIEAVMGVFNEYEGKLGGVLTPEIQADMGKAMQGINKKLEKVYTDLVDQQGVEQPTEDELFLAAQNSADFTENEKYMLGVTIRHQRLLQISGIYQGIEEASSTIEELKSKIRK